MNLTFKRFLHVFLLGFFPALIVNAQESLPYWKDVNVVAVNKEAPRTTFMSYDNAQSAIQSMETPSFDYSRSKYFQLLNGTWKFYFVEGYKKLPDNITDVNTNTSNWSDIKVPGNWELQGHGEAFYVNQPYEFATYNPTPPLLPEENPVGVYRRDIDIPADWMSRDIFLHLAGAKSGVYVYVNGKEVGYSEDSKDPAEFKINDYVNAGKNVLTLKIFRWSTGSWLECQDFLRMSGIERDVFLWSQPKTAIQDFRVKSTLDDSYKNGIFALGIDVKNTNSNNRNVVAKYELKDKSGKVITSSSQKLTVKANSKSTANFDYKLNNVATWTAENPNLYTLVMTIEEGGKVQEVVPFRVGFRRIEIKDSDIILNKKPLRLFYVNGQPIKLKGTNIHETVEDGGHYIRPDQMQRNFELMRLNNINSVRLSHYPQDRKFYEMCDVFGLYVYDEANIESHGMYYTIYQDDMRKGAVGHEDNGKRGTLGHNPDYLESHLSRIRNMYERNKNYASLTIWSLGNEAGNGFNFYNGYTLLKDLDRDLMARPVCYERALEEWNTDMIVPQYPSAGSFEYYGKNGRRADHMNNRPYVPSEYTHAMGNSNGNLYDQWVQIYKYPNLQGGYIWEWIDHAVKYVKNGRQIWAYGGDFKKDQPSDGNFVADGIVNPNQEPHPAMAEVKYVHQNVGFEAENLSKGDVKVKNRFYFKDLSKHTIRYKLFENEKLIKQDILKINIAPQDSMIVNIPMVAQLKEKPGVEYFLKFEVETNEAERLVPKGYMVAHDLFELPIKGEKRAYTNTGGPRLSISQGGDKIEITSSKVNFVFDKKSGIVTSYKVDGTEYFKDGFGIQPNFWRAPVDNDYGNGAVKRLQVWKESSKNFNITSADAKMEGNLAILSVVYKLAAGNNYIVNYKVYPSGIVNAAIEFTSTSAKEAQAELTAEAREATQSEVNVSKKKETERLEVHRIGVRFRLPVEMHRVQYLGRGPEDNYADRFMGTLVGYYKTTAEDMYYPYVRPQENGHHSDTRWVSLNASSGKGLLIEADNTIGFNALHNSIEDFDCQESNEDYQWRNMSPQEIANKDYEAAKNVLRKQTHEADITPRDFVEVCVDMKQGGVGGYDSWGARTEPYCRIFADNDYKWGFTLIPLSNESDALKKTGYKY